MNGGSIAQGRLKSKFPKDLLLPVAFPVPILVVIILIHGFNRLRDLSEGSGHDLRESRRLATDLLFKLVFDIGDVGVLQHRIKLGVRLSADAEVIVDCHEKLECLREFPFFYQVHLEVQIIADGRDVAGAILTHEDNDREDNRFKRDDHGEEDEGEGIKRRDAGNQTGINEDPEDEADQVEDEELEAAEIGSEDVCEPDRKGTPAQRLGLEAFDKLAAARASAGRGGDFCHTRMVRPMSRDFQELIKMWYFCTLFSHLYTLKLPHLFREMDKWRNGRLSICTLLIGVC